MNHTPTVRIASVALLLAAVVPAARTAAERQHREDVFEFAAAPRIGKEGGAWAITFTSKARCDATVSILNAEGRVICHLASGVLGPNAPYPFKPGRLDQRLTWDGRTDQGDPAPPGCRVRVGLGLKARFAWTAPLLDKSGKPLSPDAGLSAEQVAKWPKFKAPDGQLCLLPSADGKRLTTNRRRQVAVDPIREEVYVSSGQTCFNGRWFRLDGRTGKWEDGFRISANNIAVHPKSGVLYVRDMKSKKSYRNDWTCHFLSRRDHDGKIVKFTSPAADAEGEVLVPSDPSAKSFGDGMAFSPNGDLYVLVNIRSHASVKFVGRTGPSVIVYDGEGNQKPYRKTEFAGP